MSPQMQNLLNRYHVETEAGLLEALAHEYTENCCEPGEEPFRATDMEAVLDQMLEAEYQRIAGGANEFPEEDQVPDLCNCAVSRIYGGDCAHTAPELN